MKSINELLLDANDIGDFQKICSEKGYNPDSFSARNTTEGYDDFIIIIRNGVTRRYYDGTSDKLTRITEWPENFFVDLEQGIFE